MPNPNIIVRKDSLDKWGTENMYFIIILIFYIWKILIFLLFKKIYFYECMFEMEEKLSKAFINMS